MITEQDLRAAIAECEGERNPNSNTCIKLAAFYTIYDHLYGERSDPVLPQVSYSTSQGADINFGDSDFSMAVQRIGISEAWSTIEELVNTVSVIVPRLYDSFMRKLEG